MVEKGYLCLLAIQPTHPHTGYGYIIKGEHLGGNSYVVDMFAEKPSMEIAEQLIAKGASWNTGIYFCLAQTMLDEAEKFVPELHARARSFIASLEKDSFGFHIIPLEEYNPVIPISIDKAITEQTEKKIVIDAAIGWKDLGSWLSLYEEFEKDDNKNVLRGNAVVLETSDSYIESTNRLVTTFGLKGISIIETPDAVLVFPLEKSEQVKNMVSKLHEEKRQELVVHTKVHRPWGEYEVLGKEEKFQVKKITVLPGAELSLQRHKKRAEHWVVVSGIATVTKGEEILELCENESIYIPMNTVHKLENKTDMPISLIETQTGSYFGEDDIERLSDTYGRV
jgi:mannose-1-phosphate guanylyltransferase/mannose-6-phosphate isomerase